MYLGSDIPANGSRIHLMRWNVSVINQKKVVSLKKVQDSSLTKIVIKEDIIKPW